MLLLNLSDMNGIYIVSVCCAAFSLCHCCGGFVHSGGIRWTGASLGCKLWHLDGCIGVVLVSARLNSFDTIACFSARRWCESKCNLRPLLALFVNNLAISFDVVSLYTNISIEEALSSSVS